MSTPVQVISVSDRQYVILPPILPQALQTTQSHASPPFQLPFLFAELVSYGGLSISNFSTQSSSTTSAPPTLLKTITNQNKDYFWPHCLVILIYIHIKTHFVGEL